MFWSIWCNERWVGLDAAAHGGRTSTATWRHRSDLRLRVRVRPGFQEPASNLTRVRSRVPVLALVGGADPQDPIGNLAGLSQAMPNSRIVVVPGHGHGVGTFGCLPRVVGRFVDRGGAAKLDVRCVRRITTPPFVLP